MYSRLLNPEIIPNNIFDAKLDLIKIPPSLEKAYIELIDELNIRHLRLIDRNSSNGETGGIELEETNKHLANNFDGSAARALLAILDPKSEIAETSDNFIKVIAGSKLVLTDAPCGSGAASLAFLTIIAELRKNSILPRSPLSIHIIGAEISETARDYTARLLKKITPELEDQAIFVTSEIVKWDIMSEISNTDLIKTCIRSSSEEDFKLLLVANFSGFLENLRSEHKKRADAHIGELFRYASGDKSLAVWLEPSTNKATTKGGLLDRLKSKLIEFYNLIAKSTPPEAGVNGSETLVSSAKFNPPLQPDHVATVRLAVLPFDLTR